MKKVAGLGIIIVLFLAVVIGAALTNYTADSTELATTRNTVVNETIAMSSASGSTANQDVNAVTFFGNASNDTTKGWTLNTVVNYTTSRTAVSTITGDADLIANGNYVISYSYNQDQYVKNEDAHSLIDLVPLFFALAVLLAAVGYGWKMWKDSGAV